MVSDLWFILNWYVCIVWSNGQFEKYRWYPIDPAQLVETNILSHWVALKPLSTIRLLKSSWRCAQLQSIVPTLRRNCKLPTFSKLLNGLLESEVLITEGLHRRIFRVIELFCIKLKYWLHDSMHLSKPTEDEFYWIQNSKYQPHCQGILTCNTDGGI